MINIIRFVLAALCLGAVSADGEKINQLDLTRMADPKAWKATNTTAEFVEMNGRKVARLFAAGDSALTGNAGLASSQTVEFGTGVIELDLKGRDQRPSFLGVAFNIVDEKTFEGIYFRPFNFKASEPFHSRAVQYVAWPEHPWNELRKNHAGQFENAVNPVPDPNDWFHARIEVTDKQVRVFVNHGREPSLTVNRLAESRLKRQVGLFVDCAEGLFANLEVQPTVPESGR